MILIYMRRPKKITICLIMVSLQSGGTGMERSWTTSTQKLFNGGINLWIKYLILELTGGNAMVLIPSASCSDHGLTRLMPSDI